MAQPTDVPGTAALAICEALLLALADRDVLPKAEIIGLLQDAAAAHHHAPDSRDATALHAAVETLIDAIAVGVKAVHGP